MTTPKADIPFHWIAGLPPEAQRQIEQNFLSMGKAIDGTFTRVYDAYVDAEATADNVGTRTFTTPTPLASFIDVSHTGLTTTASSLTIPATAQVVGHWAAVS